MKKHVRKIMAGFLVMAIALMVMPALSVSAGGYDYYIDSLSFLEDVGANYGLKVGTTNTIHVDMEYTGQANSAGLYYADPIDKLTVSSSDASSVYIQKDPNFSPMKTEAGSRSTVSVYVLITGNKVTPTDPVTVTATYTTKYPGTNNTKTVTATMKIWVFPEQSTVIFDANGGSNPPASQIKLFGTNINLPTSLPTAPPSCTLTYNANGGTVSPASKTMAVTFKNWNTKADGTGTAYAPGASYPGSAGSTPASSVTLYAQWNYPTAGTLPTPTKPGNEYFVGWYTAASGGTKITSSYLVTKNTTVYARWQQDEFGNDFDTANNFRVIGGQNHVSSYLEYAGDVDTVKFTALASGSYTIQGWNWNSGYAPVYGRLYNSSKGLIEECRTNDNYVYTDFRMVRTLTKGETYYLKIAAKNGTDVGEYDIQIDSPPTTPIITFNPNGGTGTMAPQTIQQLVNTPLSANTFTRSGYVFKGWGLSSASVGVYYTDQQQVCLGDDITLYAVWQQVVFNYTVSYNPTISGNPPGSQTVTSGSSVSLSTMPAITTGSGYRFVGWSTSGNSAIGTTTLYRPGQSFTPTADITFYAIWATPISLNVPASVSIGSANYKWYCVFTPATTGSYTFGSSGNTGDPYGWLYDTNMNQLAYSDDSNGTSNFTITYSLTAGQQYIIAAGCYGTTTGSYTLTASSPASPYTVSYNPTISGNAPGSQTVAPGSSVTIGTMPTVTTTSGYRFVGWSTNSSSALGTAMLYRPGQSYTPTANTTFFAIWATPISLNASASVNIGSANYKGYYVFTPATTGAYTFKSSGNTGDPYGWLYDTNMNQLAYSDDSNGTSNFTITYSLTAGQPYIVGVGCYSTGTGSYSLQVISG